MSRLLLTCLLVVAGCAQPLERRIAARLAKAGLPQPIAQCMAERWADRLNIVQLREIAGLAERLEDERGRLTPARFVTSIGDLDDPEIVEVVTRSSVICALTA